VVISKVNVIYMYIYYHHYYYFMIEACKEIDENYNPPITFVIVGKRHHTRFYPQNKNDADR